MALRRLSPPTAAKTEAACHYCAEYYDLDPYHCLDCNWTINLIALTKSWCGGGRGGQRRSLWKGLGRGGSAFEILRTTLLGPTVHRSKDPNLLYSPRRPQQQAPKNLHRIYLVRYTFQIYPTLYKHLCQNFCLNHHGHCLPW